MDFNTLTQGFNTFKNKAQDFIGGLSQGAREAVQRFPTLPQQIKAIPSAFQQAYQPIARKATLPVSQVFSGTLQRINNPGSPISPIERKILTGYQKVHDSGVLEPGSDNYNPEIAKQYQEPSPQDENFWASFDSSQERTPSASVPWYAQPRQVSTTPALTQVRDRYLKYFSPTARFQLSVVPFGVEGAFGPAGQAGGPQGGKGITFQEQYIQDPLAGQSGHGPALTGENKNLEGQIAVHEMLHTVARGRGGIPWDNFIRDFTTYSIQNPRVAKHFGQLDRLHQTDPEELYAEMGAWLGPNIFNTPLGKYYEGILEKPKPRKIPIRKVKK